MVFLGVPLAIYLLFVIWPFIQAFGYSLTDWSGFSPKQNFIGLQNYQKLFTDDIFMKAMGNNILLVIFLPIITIVLSLVLATLVTVGGSSKGQIKGLRNSSFYRVVSFFPYTIPAIAIGIMWGQIYDPSGGLLNGILTSVGMDQFKSYAWLGDKNTAMIATMFVIVWGFIGFYMVLFVAGIKGIPAELFEAARIDGAGRFRTAVSITIPLIRDNIQTAYIYMGILALDAFVYMAALNSGGGPGQLHLGDVPAALLHRLHQGPVRPGQRHGRCARRSHPDLLRPRVPGQQAHWWRQGCVPLMTTKIASQEMKSLHFNPRKPAMTTGDRAGGRRFAHGPQYLVAHRDPATAVDFHVLLQDDRARSSPRRSPCPRSGVSTTTSGRGPRPESGATSSTR